MHLKRYLLFTPIIVFVSFNKIHAQTGSTEQSASLNNAINYFQKAIGEDAHLYTGEQFINYPTYIMGHPFFLTDDMQKSEIWYDGTLYKNIPLLFDMVSQKIVITRYDQPTRINLVSEKVKYFIFDGHRFENLAYAEGDGTTFSYGFYDILLTGKVSVLVKRVKNIKNGLRPTDPISFVDEDEYYIRNGDNLFRITGRNSVLDALHDKKNPVKIFMRKNHSRFKKNLENDLVQTVAYYLTLKE